MNKITHTVTQFKVRQPCLVDFWSSYVDVCALKYTICTIATAPAGRSQMHHGTFYCPIFCTSHVSYRLDKTGGASALSGTYLAGCELWIGRRLMCFRRTRGHQNIMRPQWPLIQTGLLMCEGSELVVIVSLSCRPTQSTSSPTRSLNLRVQRSPTLEQSRSLNYSRNFFDCSANFC